MRSLHDLYARYKGAVFGYLYRMTGSAAEAEELTQETFYQAVLSIHRFRGQANVSTWLLRIARNVYTKSLRGRDLPMPDEAFADLADPGPGPDRNLIREDDRATVARTMASLPERYRTALVLREVHELSHGDIAGIMEVSEATARVMVHRARERFRARYAREEESTG